MTPSVPVPEAIAQVLIALLYFALAAFEGNNRVLRVIDSRRSVIVVRTAQYFAAQHYGAGNAAAVPPPHLQQKQIAATGGGGGSGLHPRRTSSMGSMAVRTSAAAAVGGGGGAGGLELPSLFTDNRFLLGIIATAVGVLRSAYVVAVLFLGDGHSSSSGNKKLRPDASASTKMTSETVVNDVITLPLAILSYSLVLAVLLAHRDLMTKIRRAYGPDPPPSLSFPVAQQQQQQQQQQEQPRLSPRNSSEFTPPQQQEAQQDTAIVVPRLSGSSNPNSSTGFTPKQLQQQHQHQRQQQHRQQDGRRSPPSSRTSTPVSAQHQCQHRRGSSGPNVGGVEVEGGEFPSSATTSSSTLQQRQLQDEENTASNIINNNNDNNNNNSNNNNQASSQQNGSTTTPSKPWTETDLYLKIVRPYRTLFAIAVVAIVLITALAVEAATDNVRISEYTSPAVSLILGLWSLYSFAESYLRLRFFGAASRRVIVAILILTIYLLTRGVIVLPPVQEKLCSDNGSDYWKCFFVYSIVDALGMLLSLVVLP